MSHDAPLTIDEFKEAMPPQVRKNVQPELLDRINTAIKDPEILAVFRENVIGLATVMKDGKFKMDSYLSAVKFVSYKLLGSDTTQAWAKTFPDRYNDMQKKGYARKDITGVTSRYAASKLVILLMEQTMMPTHILNAPLFQEALNVQAALMRTAKSEMVRSQAAGRLMETLKPPEATKIELDMKVPEDASVQALRETTMKLVRLQEEQIRRGGMSVRTVAESKLIGSGETVDGQVIHGD